MPPTHGTPFRRASEEGLIDNAHPIRAGTGSGIYASTKEDREPRLRLVSAMDFGDIGAAGAAERISQRVGDAPAYISAGIDVLDPEHAPGTGTPGIGRLSSREPLGTLRRLAGTNVVGADVLEVALAYDHAEVAAHVDWELISLWARRACCERCLASCGVEPGSRPRCSQARATIRHTITTERSRRG
jgi:agmatinase